MRYFTPESIAGQPIDLQMQVVQLRSTIGERHKLPVLGLTRSQLAYRLKRLHEGVAAAGSPTGELGVAALEGALPWR